MTYCTEQQRHTDTHMHTHTHIWNHTTHTDTREPRLMVLAQVKHHRGWWNVKQQGEEASYSVFLIMQRGVTLQHCISRYDTSWLVNPRSYWRNTHTRGGEGKGERKWCISFGMMNTVNREKRRLKNRLWGEPIKGCAQMVNTLWCKAELIKVRGSGSLHFFSLGWNDFVFHLAAANPVWFDWPR